MPHLGMPQAAAGSAQRAGFRPSRDTAFSSFLPLLWLSSFSVVNCSLVLRAAYAAVCDCYPFQEATSFFLPPFFLCQVFRQLAAANVVAILGECACFCSGGAFSHISPPPCASIGLELAFTQPRRTPFFGAVRFPPTFGDPQHMTIPSSAARRCRCLPSLP